MSHSSRALRDPRVWGPVYWKTYDVIAKTYPHQPTKKQQKALLEFFHSQKYLIPCKKCVKNYRKIYSNYPPRVESRKALQDWLKILKEEVAKHAAASKKK